MSNEDLIDLIVEKILTGNRRTTAANLREVVTEMVNSFQNIDGKNEPDGYQGIDQKDENGGYLGINPDGRVDITKINAGTPTGQFLKDNGTWDYPEAPYTWPLFDHAIDISNIIAGENYLYADNLPGNTLDVDKDKLTFEYGGKIVGSADTKRIRLYFGPTLMIDTGDMAVPSNIDWKLTGWVIRKDPNTLRYSFMFNETPFVGELTPINVAIVNVIGLSGESSGGGLSDITAMLGAIHFIKAV